MRKAIINLLEAEECSVTITRYNRGEYFAELELYTPLGEDWIISFYFNGTSRDFVKQFEICYQDFDVDEAVELWIEYRGKRGVPSSIRALVEDAEWKDKWLEDMVIALNKI